MRNKSHAYSIGCGLVLITMLGLMALPLAYIVVRSWL